MILTITPTRTFNVLLPAGSGAAASETIRLQLLPFFAGVGGGTPEGTAVLSTGETGGSKFLREDGDGTSSWQAITGGGDALVANPLSQFAPTTSAQLAGVVSDETGTGALVFASSPTLTTPDLGTPSTLVGTNITGTAAGLTVGAVTGVEPGADVTDTANVTAAGALMDSEVDADIKTLSLPASTTISAFGASLIDDIDAATARATLNAAQIGDDASTDVTLAGTPDYITIAGQVITRNQIDLTADVSGVLPIANIASGTPDGTKYVRDDGTLVTPPGGSVTVKNSIEEDAGDLQLVGDSASPGADFLYGTNGAGVKGWYAIGTGGVEENDLTTSVTWANVPDANITQTSVTQHQAALSITKSQVSDFADGDYAAALGVDDNYVTDAEKTLLGVTSGTNTGDDAANSLYSGLVTNATHTGDVTGSAALTISADAVTYAKMQNVVANDVLLGNIAGAGGVVAEITATQIRTLINVADGATATSTFDALTDTNLTSNSVGDILTWDGADWVDTGVGADGYVLTASSGQSSGVAWAAVPAATSADAVLLSVRNNSGATLTKGTPVYNNGWNSGTGEIFVAEADADDPAKMPAIGLVSADISTNTSGSIVTQGILENFDTSFGSAQDGVYVSTTVGTLTATRPTGTSASVQKIGTILNANLTTGDLLVSGANRSNDVPNIAENNLWLGSATNVATSTAHTVSNISDVTITSIASDEILQWNGSAWVNQTLTEAGALAAGSGRLTTTNGVTTSADFGDIVYLAAGHTPTLFATTNSAHLWQTITFISKGAAELTVAAGGSTINGNVKLNQDEAITATCVEVGATTATVWQLVGGGVGGGYIANFVVPPTVTDTTDTLASTDHGKTIVYSNASAVTVTIPTNASVPLDNGYWVTLFSAGAGGLTLTTTSITLVGSSPNTTIAQNEALVLQKQATDTWIVIGGTAA